MEEHEAFLRQARSDFQIFLLLQNESADGLPSCHVLHYLQMTAEKLSKAAFIALGVPAEDRYSHVAFSLVPHHLLRRDVGRALGWDDFRRYRSFLRRLGPLFREVDELNPAVGPQRPGGGPQEGPNVEYPWRTRDSTGNLVWIAPADHHFALLQRLRRDPNGVALVQFVRTLLERFDAVFR